MKVYEKLMQIQSELKAPKGQFNSFGKYKYRNCEDILEALKPLMRANGTALILGDNVEQVGERHYIKATATLIDIETGEKVENTAFAREEESKKGMDGSQVTGASSSYARKYALNGLFGIDDTKDSDTTNAGETKPTIKLENKPLICTECKGEIKAVKSNGKLINAQDLANQYGKCAKCLAGQGNES